METKIKKNTFDEDDITTEREGSHFVAGGNQPINNKGEDSDQDDSMQFNRIATGGQQRGRLLSNDSEDIVGS